MTLYDFIAPLKKWWWFLAISAIVAGTVSFIITDRQPPVYQSRATLMIGQTIDNPNPSSGDLYLEQQLATSYANMANRSHVREATMETLNLDWLPQYRVIALPNTQMIEITTIDSNAKRAQAVTQEVANQLILRSPSGNNPEDLERLEFITEQLNILQTQIKDTQTEISDLQTVLGDLDSARDILTTQNQISALETKLNSLQSNYASLLATTQQSAINTLNIIEEAEVPNRPVDKNSILTAGMAAAIGLGLAAAGAYFLEFLDKSIKSIEEAAQIIEAPVIGQIPKISNSDRVWEYVSREPRSPISDSFRSLRTNIEFTKGAKDLKIILVSGPTISEGKSTIASNLARIISQANKKVILVDADLRKSVIQDSLEINENNIGLSNFLSQDIDVDDILIPLNGEDFYLVPTGHFPPNPTELLASEKLIELFDQLKEKADIIIVDSPPFIVTDAVILASRTDGIIIVVQLGHTDKNAIKAMMDQLQTIDTPILGIVANQYQNKPSYYTDYYSTQIEK